MKDGQPDYARPLPFGPRCYCHGDRKEPPAPMDQDSDAGMEWAYVFDPEKRVMFVLERVYTAEAGAGFELLSGKEINNLAGKHMTGMFGCGSKHQRWADAAVVELDKPEPDWSEMGLGEAAA